ncbi:maleylpyruvate isomerase family mycothiol-dependent enzyme [Streptomyces sp. 4N509B]|uniref:maleylpyruvate isomerase family mycothiol-dependent enzyme n=1 Tax=Streptomyces sp. 4N509B TaxID=3457413 RepID=UPI003FD260D5
MDAQLDPSDLAWLGAPIDARPLFRPELASLLDLLRGLAPADWDREAVPGWSVRDLAAHLLGDLHGRLGRGGNWRGAPAPGESLAAFIHRTNQEWVDRHADHGPARLLTALEESGTELARHYESADLHASAPIGVSWAGADPAPAWLDIAREFTEYWTHRQQIRHAVGLATDAEPRAMGTVLDTFLRALPHTLRGAPAPPGTSLAFTVDGPAGGTWTATATGERGRWSLAETPDGPPAATVRLDPETAWRLCARGIDPDTALTRAHTTGDRHLAEAACQIVSVVY